MKKLKILAFMIIACVSLAACTKTANIDFPFEPTDIKNIEMYHFIDPMDAEKKVVAEQNDITAICQSLERISLKDKTTEPIAGGSLTAFRFNLSDGTTYDVIYTEIDKGGEIKTADNDKYYFTSADVEGYWDNYDYDVISVKEEEIRPFY